MSRVLVEMDEDEWDFIVKFDPDRDRTVNRAEMTMILEYISVIVEEGRLPE